jgi:nucleotide-binding universal stress UspA family protein
MPVLVPAATSSLTALPHGGAHAHATIDAGVLRLLLPVKRLSDVDATLAYLVTLAARARLHVVLLHVTSERDGESHEARALLAYAAVRYDGHGIVHIGYIAVGDVVFTILDTAEQMACHLIVIPGRAMRFWPDLFSADTRSKVARHCRDVPLIVVETHGATPESALP